MDYPIERLAASASPHLDVAHVEAAIESSFFRRWASRLHDDFDVVSIRIRDVVMFGSRAGFVLVESEVRDAEGRRLPGVAFLRGDSVAVLLTAKDPSGATLAILTRQARTPIGSTDFHEIPAGTLDGGEFASKALGEIAEEIGADIALKEEDLVQLAECHPSPGACDEIVRVYHAELELDADQIASLRGRRGGNADENESIVVSAVPLDEAEALCAADMKSLVAIAAFRRRTVA